MHLQFKGSNFDAGPVDDRLVEIEFELFSVERVTAYRDPQRLADLGKRADVVGMPVCDQDFTQRHSLNPSEYFLGFGTRVNQRRIFTLVIVQ
jgi:hypothetical protein